MKRIRRLYTLLLHKFVSTSNNCQYASFRIELKTKYCSLGYHRPMHHNLYWPLLPQRQQWLSWTPELLLLLLGEEELDLWGKNGPQTGPGADGVKTGELWYWEIALLLLFQIDSSNIWRLLKQIISWIITMLGRQETVNNSADIDIWIWSNKCP